MKTNYEKYEASLQGRRIERIFYDLLVRIENLEEEVSGLRKNNVNNVAASTDMQRDKVTDVDSPTGL